MRITSTILAAVCLAVAVSIFACGVVHAQGSPSINIKRGTSVLTPGGTDSIGSISQTGTIVTYSIENTGSADLHLTANPAVTAGNQNNCAASPAMPSATTIPAAATATFTVNIDPVSTGSWSFSLEIATDDPSALSYEWTVSGTATSSSGSSGTKQSANVDLNAGGCTTGHGSSGLLVVLVAMIGTLLVARRMHSRTV
jgi:hypothetical protein